MPQKYYQNSVGISGRATHYPINLWTFDEDVLRNAFLKKTTDKGAVLLDLALSPRIKIRNIRKELFPFIEKHFEPHIAKEIFSIIETESEGFKNLATVSDLLRDIILLAEGGWYLDTDLEVIRQPKRYNGFPFVFRQLDENIGFYHASRNNCFIGSVPHHACLYEAIHYFIQKYQEYRYSAVFFALFYAQTKKNNIPDQIALLSQYSWLDLKRYPDSLIVSKKALQYYRKYFKISLHRRELTIELGVGAVTSTDASMKKETDPEFGFGILTTCDNTWLRKQKVTSFDTTSCKRLSF